MASQIAFVSRGLRVAELNVGRLKSAKVGRFSYPASIIVKLGSVPLVSTNRRFHY
ncbi:hypothetical protein [Bradyrhizobium sp. CCGE-LA001]|uniref:hypothetical protein n=1 Tax=Bradyrhizobium sp. CCGE-LA001 TaxID=1223566 RepID=UPI001314E978|nr:hypothetical protein [Bradyrhizobium sp. CCGE-LA001]